MCGPFLLGPLMFGVDFILSCINHFKKTQEPAQSAAAKKVSNPDAAVKLTGAVLIAGGTSILLGIKPRLGAAAIVGFLAGVSPVMHDFWKQEQPEMRMNDMINFTKNMALAGGAMALMGLDEPWPTSLAPQPSVRTQAKRMLRQSLAA